MSETLRRRGRPPKQAPVQEQSPPEPTAIESNQPVAGCESPIPHEPTWIPIQVEDVVQIVNNENKNFGVLFIVGDIKAHKVHGLGS